MPSSWSRSEASELIPAKSLEQRLTHVIVT